MIHTYYKPTETFQYTHYISSHPLGVKRGFTKGEALRLLRTNSSETTFEESISNFKSRFITRGYPNKMIQTTLSEVSFAERQSALQQKKIGNKSCLLLQHTTHRWVTLKTVSESYRPVISIIITVVIGKVKYSFKSYNFLLREWNFASKIVRGGGGGVPSFLILFLFLSLPPYLLISLFLHLLISFFLSFLFIRSFFLSFLLLFF